MSYLSEKLADIEVKGSGLAVGQRNYQNIVGFAVVVLKALLLKLPISLRLATLARNKSILRLNADYVIVTIDDDGALERTPITAAECAERLFAFEDVEDAHGVEMA